MGREHRADASLKLHGAAGLEKIAVLPPAVQVLQIRVQFFDGAKMLFLDLSFHKVVDYGAVFGVDSCFQETNSTPPSFFISATCSSRGFISLFKAEKV